MSLPRIRIKFDPLVAISITGVRRERWRFWHREVRIRTEIAGNEEARPLVREVWLRQGDTFAIDYEVDGSVIRDHEDVGNEYHR